MHRQSRGRIRNDPGAHDGGKPIGSQATQHARYRRILAQLCGAHDLATLLGEPDTQAGSKPLGYLRPLNSALAKAQCSMCMVDNQEISADRPEDLGQCGNCR
jgi:hypothetical protein